MYLVQMSNTKLDEQGIHSIWHLKQCTLLMNNIMRLNGSYYVMVVYLIIDTVLRSFT